MCEAAEKALDQDLDRQIRLKIDKQDPELREWIEYSLKKKDNVIAELANRINQWNAMKCHNCNATLRGWGPTVLDNREVEHYEGPSLFATESELDKHIKATEGDPSDAVKSLRRILANS